MAAKLLYQELLASGASPVSVPGIGYNLIEVISPSADQVITLAAIDADVAPGGYLVGDVVEIETGIILDGNSNPVPNGTIVEFHISQQIEGATVQIVRSTTDGGIAHLSVPLERTGLMSITAQSDPARVSDALQFNVQQGIPAQATVISPTRVPTVPSEPTKTVLVPTPTQDLAVGEDQVDADDPERVGIVDLVLALLSMMAVGGVGYVTGAYFVGSERYRIRCTLVPVVTALLGYNYLALSLPGTAAVLNALRPLAGFAIPLFTGLLGIVISHLWCRLPDRLSEQTGHHGNE
jgi:beta-N-acetylhexosaminidase